MSRSDGGDTVVYIRERDVRDDVRYVRNVTYSERQEQRASRSTDCSYLKCKVCCNSLLGVVKVRASVGRAGVGGGRMRSAKILCTGCSPICARRVCSLSRCVPCTSRQYVHRSSMKRKEQKRAASAGPGAASTSRGGCHRRRPLYHSATQKTERERELYDMDSCRLQAAGHTTTCVRAHQPGRRACKAGNGTQVTELGWESISHTWLAASLLYPVPPWKDERAEEVGEKSVLRSIES